MKCARRSSSAKQRWRSACPLNICLEMVGDRWSLLILRDMMLRSAHSFKDLTACPEKIATNVLADRLRKLRLHGIVRSSPDARDRRKQLYSLTDKGIDLAPVLAEMVLWSARHEHTGNAELVKQLRADKAKIIANVRREHRRRTKISATDGARMHTDDRIDRAVNNAD